MVSYYRTSGGLYYKEYANGRKVRVSRLEGQTGGAAKKASPKRSKSRASPKRSKSRASPKRSPIRYTPEEQMCIDYAQAKIDENKKLPKGTFKHIGHLVAVSYEQARAEHPECLDFFDREKVRKAALRKARRASKKKSRRSRKRKTRSKKRVQKKSPKKSPRK